MGRALDYGLLALNKVKNIDSVVSFREAWDA